jgi:cytochrome P450
VTDVRYNPYDYAIHADPYPAYARLREVGLSQNDDLDFWAISRYADVHATSAIPARTASASNSGDPKTRRVAPRCWSRPGSGTSRGP